jgi:hypothetical protein
LPTIPIVQASAVKSTMKDIRAALWQWTWRWGLRGLALTAGLGLLLFGLLVIGRATRECIRQQDRYQVAFADIDCRPPPARERTDFLAEVRYLSTMPARLDLLDDALPVRLAEAFAHHRWVEKVERVAVVPPGRIEVRLVYRTPVLAVWIAKPGGGYGVEVDAHGVRLGSAGLRELPSYTPRTRTADADGRTWDEASVIAAAHTAGFLWPYQDRLHVKALEGTADRLVLKGGWPGRVLWGPAPGHELPTQARAALKLKRLLRYCATTAGRHGDEVPPYDLRSPDPEPAGIDKKSASPLPIR